MRRLGASVAAAVAAPGAAHAQARQPAPRRRAPAQARTRPAPKPRPAPPPEPAPVPVVRGGWPQPAPGARIDLAPARWIWLPAGRTLAGSFVLFRRELELAEAPVSARGFVSADSRYRLLVNGRRVQWGPAPCDPRSLEADPLDLSRWLVSGRNVIGVEVLYYGRGEGTWPLGSPGMLFALRVEQPGGAAAELLSDESWQVRLDRAHRPGQFRRSAFRALQEEFDARAHPHGWSEPSFTPDASWLAPELDGGPQRPADLVLRAREVPLVRETLRPMGRLVQSGRVRWRRDARDHFELAVPGSFEATDGSGAGPAGEGAWRVEPGPGEGVFACFELPEQMVGFPFLTVEAEEGTVVELLFRESVPAGVPAWLGTDGSAWTRLVCRAGENRFECFEYESLRFLLVHVREASAPVLLRDVGLRRRGYPWPEIPSFRCPERGLQRLFEACFNTLTNSAQETVVDGMARTRLQSSSGVAHQLQAARLVCGDRQLARRFLRSYPMGQAGEGFFLDGWPADPGLAHFVERQLGFEAPGPALEQGLTLAFDALLHYQESGESDVVLQLYPRLERFCDYLLGRRDKDGLLPVEGWGVPSVRVVEGLAEPRQTQCALNLLAAAALGAALAPLATLAGDAAGEKRWSAAAAALATATAARFWSRERSLFVANLPWQDEEGGPRLDDRSLALALLHDLVPNGSGASCLAALAEPGAELVLSPPAHAHWRMQALARHGRIDAVLRELRERWAALPSVLENNTIAERYEPGAGDEWSHCGIAPLLLLYTGVAGIRPAAPGFAKVEVRPQLHDLEELELVCHTPRGAITFRAVAQEEGHRAFVTLPADCAGELVLPLTEGKGVAVTAFDKALGLERFALPPGETTEFDVPASRVI